MAASRADPRHTGGGRPRLALFYGSARSLYVIDGPRLKSLDAQQLREVVRALIGDIEQRDREIAFRQAAIAKITQR
jgi:hypothetical protein